MSKVSSRRAREVNLEETGVVMTRRPRAHACRQPILAAAMIERISAVTGLIVVLSLASGARAQTEDELAMRFYPKALDDDFAANHLEKTNVLHHL